MGWFEERFNHRDGTMRFDCISCSKPMYFPPSKFGKYKTCGGDCAKQKFSDVKKQRERNCATCGSIFTPRPRQLASGNGNYCSQKCNVKSHMAMNSKESQAKSKASYMETMKLRKFHKSGSDSPLWKGGRDATYRRQIESGKRRIYWMNRKRAGGTTRSPATVVQQLGKRQRWRCAACRKKLLKYEVDHIFPVSMGGGNETSNLQLLCVPCNRKKCASHPVDFMQSIGYLL